VRIARKLRRSIAASVFMGALWLGCVPAYAQSYPGGGQTPPAVEGRKFFPEKVPRTGTDILLYLIIALLILLIGIGLRRLARREAAADD
jgi:hypothetical protein